jgi:hypothetical protein
VQRWVFDRVGLGRWDYVDDATPERTSLDVGPEQVGSADRGLAAEG